jgi:carboxypeptidase D
MCMNVYDVRLMDDWPACGMNWPPDLTEVYDFLRVSPLFRVFDSGL